MHLVYVWYVTFFPAGNHRSEVTHVTKVIRYFNSFFVQTHCFIGVLFQITGSNNWNMSHFFHSMLAVKFQQGISMSMARKDADEQLSFWIDDSNLRAWLLMNMMADSDTGKIRWRCNVQGIFDSFNSHLGTLFFQLELLIF